MANLRRHHIYLREFSDYAYKSLKASTESQRSNLDHMDLKIFKTDSTLRDFCHNDPFERVLTVLTKIGKSWDLRIYDKQEDADELEFNVMDQFQYPEKRSDMINCGERKNIYHMSAMDILICAHMAAQNVHNRTYYLSERARDNVRRIRAWHQTRTPFYEQMQQSNDAVEDFFALILETLNSFDWSQTHMGIIQPELRIMAALYKKRDGALSLEELEDMTRMNGKKKAIDKHLERLMREGLVFSDEMVALKSIEGKDKRFKLNPYYMISPKGVDVMMKYWKHLYDVTFEEKK